MCLCVVMDRMVGLARARGWVKGWEEMESWPGSESTMGRPHKARKEYLIIQRASLYQRLVAVVLMLMSRLVGLNEEQKPSH